MKTIFKFSFSVTLTKLEIYLDITRWLREYIVNYTAIAKSLQDRKTAILTASPRIENERKMFALYTSLKKSTNVEIVFFQVLQNTLSKSFFLIHFDNKQTLYIDLNINKNFEFEAIIYYIDDDILKNIYLLRSKIRPVLFLNRLFKDAETRY